MTPDVVKLVTNRCARGLSVFVCGGLGRAQTDTDIGRRTDRGSVLNRIGLEKAEQSLTAATGGASVAWPILSEFNHQIVHYIFFHESRVLCGA